MAAAPLCGDKVWAARKGGAAANWGGVEAPAATPLGLCRSFSGLGCALACLCKTLFGADGGRRSSDKLRAANGRAWPPYSRGATYLLSGKAALGFKKRRRAGDVHCAANRRACAAGAGCTADFGLKCSGLRFSGTAGCL